MTRCEKRRILRTCLVMQASEFEGGYRVAAFVAGGALPPAVRGTIQVRVSSTMTWGRDLMWALLVCRKAWYTLQTGSERSVTSLVLVRVGMATREARKYAPGE